MIPTLMILLAVLGRLVPHPPNLAPQGAIAVFAGRTLPLRLAIPLTLGAMFLGDLALSKLRGYEVLRVDTLFVYAGFVIQALLGSALRQRRGGALLAAGLGAVVFFVLSNLGVYVGGMYGHGATGLAQTFVLALPFFPATLIGDVAWTVALTFCFEVLSRRLRPSRLAPTA